MPTNLDIGLQPTYQHHWTKQKNTSIPLYEIKVMQHTIHRISVLITYRQSWPMPSI